MEMEEQFLIRALWVWSEREALNHFREFPFTLAVSWRQGMW